jgi:uncharacterized protein (TIGR02996 family)
MRHSAGGIPVMSIEDAFLHDILAHPDDDAPRLIYADWLDEHNDPRGEFIRIQCVLAQLSDEDPRRWPLEQREQQLLRDQRGKWLPKDIADARCVFRRGFVEEVTLYVHDFLSVFERLLERFPLQYICLRGPINSAEKQRDRERTGWNQIARSPLLARLHGLNLAFPLDVEGWRSVCESPYLANLQELKITGTSRIEDVVRDWAALTNRPALRSLTLCQNALNLVDLPALANCCSLTGLRELYLIDNLLTHRAARVLAEGRLLQQLERLHLDANLLGDTGALIISEWPALPRLTRLSLGHNRILPAGMRALAKSHALRELKSLDLFGNISSDDGTSHLAFAEWTRLQALNLRFNGVGDEGVRAIAQTETLSQLTRLNLTANRITSKGARALIESSGLPRLARLDLLRNDIGAAEQEKLRDRFGPHVYC